ncbi:PspC domain-containing protein [Mucilaginibacter sp. OK098]|uniref:PspC domain-containing protein n=1 Tax=Mucilaginibacter sp. OK098 TaxID=1855297 RepID=UPI00091C0F5C|nr:PspC domain-containing protein [Mucilaginibacter sp. OK098]SHN20549.1 phage shock protein C (PspC) family protein [Mucilaginibacter sp. OK098]
MNKKLYRDEYHKVFGGVCSGLAEYFEMDVTVMRLLFAFTFFIMGVGFGTYIILWIVLPRKGFMYNNYNNPTVDYTVPPQQPAGQFNNPQQSGNLFGSNPFGDNTYGSNPFSSNPTENIAPKQKSHAGIIIGLVLIVIGAAILVDEYDLIPDFDFGKLWPIVLVIVGGSLIISGQKREEWRKKDLNETAEKEDPAVEDPATPTTDNTPTV